MRPLLILCCDLGHSLASILLGAHVWVLTRLKTSDRAAKRPLSTTPPARRIPAATLTRSAPRLRVIAS